jgi:hypothetical protein
MGSGSAEAEGAINGGFGLGVEVSLTLMSFDRGALVASSTPFFVLGSMGNAFCLPAGLAYRFR